MSISLISITLFYTLSAKVPLTKQPIVRIILDCCKKEKTMSVKCELTGKGKQFGNKVSLSLRRTKKTFSPNLQTKTVVINGQKKKMRLSTKALKTLKKA